VITDPEHLRRYNQAEAIVRGVLTSRRCLAFFRANCTSGAANPLQEAFDRANVYIRLVDDATTGEQIGDNISFNLRAFRIGRWRIANALLHETFHVCDPVFDARDEIDAETAVEQCRVFTPFISNRRPRSGSVGTRVTIEGIGFGPSQGPADRVLFNGVDAGRAVSWGLVGTPGSSLARIVCEVPAGATTGDLVVVNNTVRSNALRFEVTP
jgi:IPT/TIG domain